MRSPWWLAWVLLGVATVALAKRGSEVAEAEAGMDVTGTILVGPEGKPLEYELDDPQKLPEAVRRYLDVQIARWQFEPPTLDGRPVSLRNRMSIHVKAVPHVDGGMRMQVASASFQPTQEPAGYEIRATRMTAPDFPSIPTSAVSYQVGATVYLVLKIGPDGKVLDLLDEQVNLHFVPDWGTDGRWRNHFASSALRTARGWRFNPPTQGEAAGLPYWSVRVPVRYIPWNERIAYGQWVAYVPRPATGRALAVRRRTAYAAGRHGSQCSASGWAEEWIETARGRELRDRVCAQEKSPARAGLSHGA